MEKFNWFLGVDVSKDTLDLSLFVGTTSIDYRQIENSPASVRSYFKQIKTEFKVQLAECLVCLEHTGIYNNHLLDTGLKLGLKIWVESALAIKLSCGISRVKNDKVDSAKIAVYAYRFQDKAKLWEPSNPTIELLNQLSKQREKLLKVRHQLEVSIGEKTLFMEKTLVKRIKDAIARPLKAVKVAIKALDAQIDEILNTDEQIKCKAKIITSVPGVGKVTAVKLIVTTNLFMNINDPRKYACYGGVAPFESTSGTSVRGKMQVSKKANLSVKALLSLCATSAIAHDPELRGFYLRKVEEGKNKMSVINAVRNKIIHRIFACVNQNRMFEMNYQNSLA